MKKCHFHGRCIALTTNECHSLAVKHSLGLQADARTSCLCCVRLHILQQFHSHSVTCAFTHCHPTSSPCRLFVGSYSSSLPSALAGSALDSSPALPSSAVPLAAASPSSDASPEGTHRDTADEAKPASPEDTPPASDAEAEPAPTSPASSPDLTPPPASPTRVLSSPAARCPNPASPPASPTRVLASPSARCPSPASRGSSIHSPPSLPAGPSSLPPSPAFSEPSPRRSRSPPLLPLSAKASTLARAPPPPPVPLYSLPTSTSPATLPPARSRFLA